MKLRKNEMKVRKNDFKVQGNLPFAPWRISIPSVESPFLREVTELVQGELTTVNTGKCNSNRMKMDFHAGENGFSYGRKWIFMRMKILYHLEEKEIGREERGNSCVAKS